jgi:hypothetical protein
VCDRPPPHDVQVMPGALSAHNTCNTSACRQCGRPCACRPRASRPGMPVLRDSKRLHRDALCIWSSEPDATVVRELCAC